MNYKVHIGFGFHVNCYHSYRGDTCDTLGFGGDIRTIRYLLDTLDQYNEKGVSVKGTWDFENAYTLESILPKYAPDIIERVNIRQKEHGDANILMGYNNGAMSAMTEDEFMASVKCAVTNYKKSGLKDLFGAYEPVIRPQEVMFTPSQAALYKKAGIEAVCLYYSCIPFDGFRTLIRELPDEQAFNPLRYHYEEGEITVIPTYSQADLMDAGSLKHLVKGLHEKQEKGEIQNDLFLFVNIDADSFLWEPFPIPNVFRKIPNINGLEGLISEVMDIPYVEFDTPGHYLKNHDTVGEISFGEDIADGNYSGYSSWAEKPFNRLIWTRLERARMYASLYEKDSKSPSFSERIKLLSTTHFGLASPVLNISRERKALQLSDEMIRLEEFALKEKWELKSHNIKKNEVWIKNRNTSSFINMQLTLEKGFCTDIMTLKMKGEGLKHNTVLATKLWDDGSIQNIYCACRFEKIKRKYKLTFHIKKRKQEKKLKKELKRESEKARRILRDKDQTMLLLDDQTDMPVLYSAEGQQIAAWHSWIHYGEQQIPFNRPQCTILEMAGDGEGLLLTGEIHTGSETSLKREKESGQYQFRLFTMEEEQGFFVVSQICYPYTNETTEITTSAYNLGRFCDLNWMETAPMELKGQYHDDVTVEKRNFMNAISSYPMADFWQSIPTNQDMDAMNHQLTGGILSVQDSEKGILIAHARQVLGSMAHCPMRLRTKQENQREISMNPFGTYDGKQRAYPSRGNGCMMDIYQTIMPQAKSLAPAYNGAYEMTAQWLCDRKQLSSLTDQTAFADGCVVYATSGAISRMKEDNVVLYPAKKIGVKKNRNPKMIPPGISTADIIRMLKNYLTNIK